MFCEVPSEKKLTDFQNEKRMHYTKRDKFAWNCQVKFCGKTSDNDDRSVHLKCKLVFGKKTIYTIIMKASFEVTIWDETWNHSIKKHDRICSSRNNRRGLFELRMEFNLTGKFIQLHLMTNKTYSRLFLQCLLLQRISPLKDNQYREYSWCYRPQTSQNVGHCFLGSASCNDCLSSRI